MKLHLNKSLRAALLACVCGFATMASSAWALELQGDQTLDLNGAFAEDITGTGNLTITGTGTLQNTQEEQQINFDGNLIWSTTGKVEIGGYGSDFVPATIGAQVGDITVKSGAYMYLTCHSVLQNSGSLTLEKGATFTANSGTTVKISDTIINNGLLELKADSQLVVLNSATLDQVNNAYTEKDADGKDVLVNGMGTTTYTIAAGDGTIHNAVAPASLAAEGMLAGKAITLAGNTITVTGSTYFVQSANKKYDAEVAGANKIVVANGYNLNFDAVTTPFNGDVEISGTGNNDANGAISIQPGKNVTINGTLTVQGGDTSINAWGKYEGADNSGPKSSLTVNDLVLNSKLTYNENSGWAWGSLTVSNDVTGSGDLQLNTGDISVGGDIATTGAVTVNKASADTTTDLAVAGGVSAKSLTVSGGATASMASLATTEGASVTGAGSTLSFTAATSSASGALQFEDGTILDLTGVTTFDAAELVFESGAIVKIDETTRINISDSLTIHKDVVFDVSGWTDNDGYHTISDLFTYTGEGEFTPQIDGYVTIKTSNSENTQAVVKFDPVSGTVALVPEPTTATLSLLALAGLAARRRRK